jgi:hypothetical protein
MKTWMRISIGLALLLATRVAAAQPMPNIDAEIARCKQQIDAGQNVYITLAGIKNSNNQSPATLAAYQACADAVGGSSGTQPIIVPNKNGIFGALFRKTNSMQEDNVHRILDECGSYASQSASRAINGNGIRLVAFSNGNAALSRLIDDYGVPSSWAVDQVTFVAPNARVGQQTQALQTLNANGIPTNYLYSLVDIVETPIGQSLENWVVSTNLPSSSVIQSSSVIHSCAHYLSNINRPLNPPRNTGSGGGCDHTCSACETYNDCGEYCGDCPPPPTCDEQYPCDFCHSCDYCYGPDYTRADDGWCVYGTVETHDCYGGMWSNQYGQCYSCWDWEDYCYYSSWYSECDDAALVCGFSYS